jgi:hypothetical protein
MIDMATYRKLHSESVTREPAQDDIGPEAMAQEDPPGDGQNLLFPSRIIGYNLRLKKWGK